MEQKPPSPPTPLPRVQGRGEKDQASLPAIWRRGEKEKPMQPYAPPFFAQLQAGALRSARAVVPALLELLHPSSVVDVGCGLGAWLAVCREMGVQDVLGVDGGYVERSQL